MTSDLLQWLRWCDFSYRGSAGLRFPEESLPRSHEDLPHRHLTEDLLSAPSIHPVSTSQDFLVLMHRSNRVYSHCISPRRKL